MRTVNLDMLVRAGEQPWHPVPRAQDIDVWDKYDFPICGTFRLDGHLIVFTLVATAGNRSLWAYVPVPPEDEEMVAGAQFDSEAEFDEFLDGRFAGREAVFAAAESLIITAKSDGVPIPPGRRMLLVEGARWYAGRASADADEAFKRVSIASTTGDPAEMLRAAQGALSGIPS